MISEMTLETLKGFVSEENIILDAPLSDYTTFKIGGPASCLIEIGNTEQLKKIMNYLKLVDYPFFVLGNGSNILFSDEGYDGIILHIGNKFNEIVVEGNIIRAQAGAMLSKVSKVALASELSGLEFAAGIPGSIGGAAVMNAGAYGGEMSQVVKSVSVVSTDGQEMKLDLESLEYGYRHSSLMNNKFIVVEIELELSKKNPDEIKNMMEDFNGRRREKQPLEYPSAGSTFKRPEGYFAGKLIMDSNLAGFQIGGARISEKHCGFVVNVGDATAKDVRDIIEVAKEKVFENYGVTLEPEIVIMK